MALELQLDSYLDNFFEKLGTEKHPGEVGADAGRTSPGDGNGLGGSGGKDFPRGQSGSGNRSGSGSGSRTGGVSSGGSSSNSAGADAAAGTGAGSNHSTSTSTDAARGTGPPPPPSVDWRQEYTCRYDVRVYRHQLGDEEDDRQFDMAVLRARDSVECAVPSGGDSGRGGGGGSGRNNDNDNGRDNDNGSGRDNDNATGNDNANGSGSSSGSIERSIFFKSTGEDVSVVRQAQEMRRQVAFGGGAVVEEEGEGEGDKLHQKVKQVGVWV